MAENYYDVIIIGGGPSGATCGIFLKKLNPSLRVCIIDKQRFPRKKPCGDGLSPGVIDIIKEMGLDTLFLEKYPISNFELSCENSIEIKYDLRNLSASNSYGFVYKREHFDDQLLRHAIELGVQVFQKHEIAEIKEVDKLCTQIICKSGNNKPSFFGKIIVGADGAYSKMRSYLNVPANGDKHLGIGLRYYCTIKSSAGLSLRIDILKDLKYSYGWVFPTSNEEANVGIGVDAHVYKTKKINLNEAFDSYIEFLRKKMPVEIIPGTRAGYPLPYGSQLPELIHGNKVLIGDAASMINPLTGEGIYYGMYAGKMLAENVANAFTTDSKLDEALVNFSVEFKKRFQKHYQLNLTIKKLLSSPLADMLLNMVSKDKALLNKAMQIMLGNSNSFEVPNLKFKMIKKSTKYIYGRLKKSISK